jgi:hypothetical protein
MRCTCGDYARVLFQFRTRGYGCELRTRHSLRPLIPEGRYLQNLGRRAPREGGAVIPHGEERVFARLEP